MLLVMKNKTRAENIRLLTLFLALEIMLFIAFDLGNIGTILKSVAIVFAIILLPLFWKETKADLASGLYFLLMPLFFYGIFLLLSPAYGKYDGYISQSFTIMGYSMFEQIISAFALLAIILLGYFLQKSRVFSTKAVYITLLAGLALPLFISLIATLASFGFFHTLLYKGKVIFYNGQAYSVANQAMLLFGFKLMNVDIGVLINSALLVTSAAAGLLFVKKDSNKFVTISLSIIGGIGLLTLILTGSFLSLLFLLPALIFALLKRFDLLKKLDNKITGIVLLSVLGVGVLVFIMGAFNIFNIQGFYQRVPFLRKIFFNSYMQRFYTIFSGTFSIMRDYVIFEKTFRAFTMTGFDYNYAGALRVFPSHNLFFDVFWIDGLFSFLFLMVFLVLAVIVIYRYFKESEDETSLKVALISVFITIFIRSLLNYQFNRFVFDENWSINHFPLINQPEFLVFVFTIGYMFKSKNRLEVASNETE